MLYQSLDCLDLASRARVRPSTDRGSTTAAFEDFDFPAVSAYDATASSTAKLTHNMQLVHPNCIWLYDSCCSTMVINHQPTRATSPVCHFAPSHRTFPNLPRRQRRPGRCNCKGARQQLTCNGYPATQPNNLQRHAEACRGHPKITLCRFGCKLLADDPMRSQVVCEAQRLDPQVR